MTKFWKYFDIIVVALLVASAGATLGIWYMSSHHGWLIHTNLQGEAVGEMITMGLVILLGLVTLFRLARRCSQS